MALDEFLDALTRERPTLARIDDLTQRVVPVSLLEGFSIQASLDDGGTAPLVSPDVAVCEDCLRELFDSTDRRHQYPFINCTNCGPRFTIIESVPYDRPRTTMASFRMCPTCEAEYLDPLNRRFHAQPNACPVCGPKLEFQTAQGEANCSRLPLEEAVERLNIGEILAIKGVGGFHLAVDARNDEAVMRLRHRKHRPSKPLAVMAPDVEALRRECKLDAMEEALLLSPERPIVVASWLPSSSVARSVAPGLDSLGVMLPSSPLHEVLMASFGGILVMTSGNRSEEPIAIDNAEARIRLGDIADGFLSHDRPILSRCDDSVYAVSQSPRPLRRGRGFAPLPISLLEDGPSVLACGAQEKNTFCLTSGTNAFISQHIGDLDNLETANHFRETVMRFRELFRIAPEVIVHDLHPDLVSTHIARELAAELGLPLSSVQHHHAHIVSCMAENRATAPVIGVAFDGTGLGDDGTIWGGEFLLATPSSYQRLGHLETFPLPGGEGAIRKPRRLAYAACRHFLGAEETLPSSLTQTLGAPEVRVIENLLDTRLNTPMTSSAGRLFDVVSALLGVRSEVDYEGQGAVELEVLARCHRTDLCSPYLVPCNRAESGMVVPAVGTLLEAVVEDLSRGVEISAIALRFHATVASMILNTCQILRTDTGVGDVALSGGVFQNRLLCSLVVPQLEGAGFRVLQHRLVPCNDGGISLGQAGVGMAQLSKLAKSP